LDRRVPAPDEEDRMAIPATPRLGLRRLAAVTVLASIALAAAPAVSAQDNVVTFGSNASDPAPKAALQAVLDYCAAQTGLTININTVDHNTFQDTLTSYLQGTPDDVFTWFAGFRARYFANQGLLTPIDDVWEQIGANYSDAMRAASVGDDGQMYFVPFTNYPWVVMYRKSVFEEKGYAIPATWDELVALLEQMKTDGLIPMAMGDQDGWPAQGTFDILNMRLNGYQFHIDLLGGKEQWTDPRVTAVFERWRELVPYYNDGAIGLKWQDGAQLLTAAEPKAGLHFLGTFATQQAPDAETAADIDFFPFPTLGTEFDGENAIDAPIDGYLLSKTHANPAGDSALMVCLGTGAAQNVYLQSDPSVVATANDADKSGYTPLQQKSDEIIANSGKIAQFLDRDTIPAFAGKDGMQTFLQSFLSDPNQDLAALQQTIQAKWDEIAAEEGL
jgi:multiple sugar transport system substrate-binding protein